MFADKSMQGLTFLLDLPSCARLGRLKGPTLHCVCRWQGLLFRLMVPGCRWEAPRLDGASCSSLDLCQAALMQKEAQESHPGLSVQFCAPDPVLSWSLRRMDTLLL